MRVTTTLIIIVAAVMGSVWLLEACGVFTPEPEDDEPYDGIG